MENLRKMLIAGLTLVAFSFMAFTANAQSATLDKQTKQIVLDVNEPVSNIYKLDMTGLNLTSKDEADAYFAKYRTPYILWAYDFQAKIATIEFNGALIADRALTVKQWNAILVHLNQ